MKDGTVGAYVTSDSGKGTITLIDQAAKSWGKKTDLTVNIANTLPGGKQYDFSYNDGTALYGYSLTSNKTENILSWINCDMDGDTVQYATVQDDGNVFAVTGRSNMIMNDMARSSSEAATAESDPYSLVTLTKTARSSVKQKTTLRLATMYLDYNIRKEILNFNKTNQDVRIEVKDYSEFNTNSDTSAGITKLSTEMVSGNIPDLLDITQLPYRQYAAKGLLEDLLPYLDKDADFPQSAFLPNILKAAEVNGKLCELPSGFAVSTIAGSPKKLGAEMGWTMDEMRAVLKQHPEADYPFGAYMTRQNILDGLILLNMGNYIDWTSGKCSFNTAGFKGLLSFAKSFPDKMPDASSDDKDLYDDFAMVRSGREIMTLAAFSDFSYYQQYKYQYGGDVVFKGLPADDRKGNVAVFTSALAMTSSCADKASAWKFMRRILSDDFQENSNWSLPVTQKAYNSRLAKAMKDDYETDENGQQKKVPRGSYTDADGKQQDYYALSQEDADRIKALVDSVTQAMDPNQQVTSIIDEEAGSFFSGAKTVDQVADIIQSRMNVYVNERK